ncbi:MAG: sensor histidine kinase [Desulfobulbaceae bacterium]|nr:sensor histidine kinase [Desulfobulbaceae bacterium]
MSNRSGTVHNPPDLELICRRVREKAISYDQYNFSSQFNDFLKAFFDLAQEFDSLEDFYRICIAVPLEMTGLASALYIREGKEQTLRLVCNSDQGVLPEPEAAREPVHVRSAPYELDDSYIIPICSKQLFGKASIINQQDREQVQRQTDPWCEVNGRQCCILGMYEVRSLKSLSESDKFFFVKYTNRIGYKLDNRLLALQNIDHLKFINTLVMDIEHNVIVPNMYFRHLFNQLRKKIVELDFLLKEIKGIKESGSGSPNCDTCLSHCSNLRRDLLSYHQELVKHHANMSLFLESLFRREHFERGHLVLHPKRCFVEKEVILPQLEHYRSRLQAADITVERPRDMQEEFPLLVDVGLLAQVYANLFSNVAKYTREIVDHHGKSRKVVAYGWQMVHDYPEAGKKGLKFNVFSTGLHLSMEEGAILFVEGVRGEDSHGIPGTGHGLSFIRHVIEMHGGTVGYESTPQGNNFYFILPLPTVDYPLTLSGDGK